MQYIGARGQGLLPPQALYPVSINEQPQIAGTNRVTLPPGGDILIPPGVFLVSPGIYSQTQFLDPVTTTWLPYRSYGQNALDSVNSDGTNYRVINPTGFPIGALVNAGGNSYTSAPTVTPSIGGSTWTAVVGGAIVTININAGGSGANYAVPPIVNIASPPAGGVQATAVCAISGGLITGFTIVNPGAGYASAPAIAIIPQQSDLNEASPTVSVTDAQATAVLSYAGTVTAVLLTNEGNNPLTSVPGLSFAGGGGSGPTATAIMAFTVTGATVTTPGSGYTAPVGLLATGGTVTSSAAAGNSPIVSTGLLVPRQIWWAASTGSGNGISVNNALIIDGGLFQAPPSLVAFPGPAGTSPSALAVLAATVGGVNDTVTLQPA